MSTQPTFTTPPARLSWGRTFNYRQTVHSPLAIHDALPQNATPLLGYGLGRSYGDSCLNENGTLISSRYFDHFIAFDTQSGVLRCEAGVSLATMLEVIVPRGWFIPVTPGTKFVTLAGAIANDVHGKNHVRDGTFGCHVRCFELLRSDGQRLLCSPTENSELFNATIGGLGLTGFIVWAEIQLQPVINAFINDDSFRCDTLAECLDLFQKSESHYQYRVAWIDCLARGKQLGRGIFTRGNHCTHTRLTKRLTPKNKLSVPLDFPNFALNSFTVRNFNRVYLRKLFAAQRSARVSYDSFFYPLDGIHHWNRIYGKRGFMQYQCCVTRDTAAALTELLTQIAQSGQASFLSVLKAFGAKRSPGMLSFPREGYTLALDFPHRGDKTLALFDRLDAVVRNANGAIYPAKDSRMSPDMFTHSFPHAAAFAQFIDPAFSSSFWRRVQP